MMEEKTRIQRKRKAGSVFRKEREIRQRGESAQSCKKITTLFTSQAQSSGNDTTTLSTFSTKHDEMRTNITVDCHLENFQENSSENPATLVTFSTKHDEISTNITVDRHLEHFQEHSSENPATLVTFSTKHDEMSINNTETHFLEHVLKQNLDEQKQGEIAQQMDADFKENKDLKIEVLGLSNIGQTDFFKKPGQNNLNLFFSFHPVQPIQQKDTPLLPFDSKIFHVKQSDDQIFKRNWLSYNTNNRKLYCSVCLAFTDGSSVFCQGFDRYRHLSQTLGEHEKSNIHIKSVKAYMTYKQGRTMETLLFKKQLDKREKEIMERRKIVSAVIDVIKLIGKQGLAFRGKEEAAYSFDDPSINHGNFLEVFFLLANYDENLAKHVKNVTEKSRSALEVRKGSRKKGRGSQITFLSKTTVTKIINIIKLEIQTEIAKEVKQARLFSVLMDTTMDVSSYDQCIIVLRYILEKEVKETVLALVCVKCTTGEFLFNKLQDSLNSTGLDIKNCVANAFDGASNMSGEYSGVSSRLRAIIPNHVHTWCYAHVVNLVMSDTAQCLPTTISFFGLLQQTQVFLKYSHKRLSVYLEQNPRVRLSAIGATRWRSRSDATTKLFGRFHEWFHNKVPDKASHSEAVFMELIITLNIIANSKNFNSNIRNEAHGMLQKFLSFETIVVAMMFVMIFKITTPLSDYLQTKNLDYAQAWKLVSTAKNELRNARNNFNQIINAAKTFVRVIAQKLDEKLDEEPSLELENIYIDSKLPPKRIRTVKKMPGELANDENIGSSEEDRFRIKVFNIVIDKLNASLETRFVEQKNLYLDLACFDPRRFSELGKDLPANSFDKICELLPTIDRGKLTEELHSFIQEWPKMISTLQDDVNENIDSSMNFGADMTEDEESEKIKACQKQDPCKACLNCVYKVIYDYNMYCLLYTELSKVYKYLLTIPLTQVSCERAFSKLKLIKTRLRSNISNENLEAFLLMQCERDKLVAINNDVVIDRLCEQSEEMKRLLSF